MGGHQEEAPTRPGFISVMGRELRRIRGQGRYFLLLLVLPIFSALVVWGVLKAGTPRELPVAVCDLDGSAGSRRLVRMMDAAAGVAVLPVADPVQGEDLVRRGRAYALVVLPRDLEKSLKKGQGGEVVCYYNTQSLLVGNLISRDLARVVGTVSAEVEAGFRLGRGEGRPAVMARLEPVQAVQHVLYDPQLNYLYFLGGAFVPTFLHLFIIFAGVTALGSELKEGTASDWLRTAGGKVRTAVLGKLSVYFIWFVFMGLAMLFWLFAVLGAPQHGAVLLMAAATVLLVLAALGMSVLAVTLFPSLRLATSAASFYAGTAFAFAGITFPISGMLPVARAWSHLVPLTHYLRVLSAQAVRGSEPWASWPDLLALLVFPAVGAAAAPFLGRHLRDVRSWRLT